MAEAKFTPGGKVQAWGGLYVRRDADTELADVCRSGAIAVVLHSRQVGKSSLITNVATELEREGMTTIVVDFTKFGTQEVSTDQWYLGVLNVVVDQADLDVDLVPWWDAHIRIPATLRFQRFLKEILLRRVASGVVILFDEIDTMVGLPVSDDFFACLREMYQSRDRDREFSRLSFVLSGSSSPDDLMRDSNRTPFNVGVRIDVKDFTLQECLQFVAALPSPADQAARVIEWVYAWTSGHPFLTQVLCARIAEEQSFATLGRTNVDEITRQTLLSADGSKNKNLLFVRQMLTAPNERPATGEMPEEPVTASASARPHEQVSPLTRELVLETYRRILDGRRIADDAQVRVLAHLKLAGVVVERGGYLEVRNAIYREVFGRRWVRSELPFNWKRAATITIGVLVALLGGILFYQDQILAPAARRSTAIAKWTKALADARTNDAALEAYEFLAGKNVEPEVGRVSGFEKSAIDLYEGYWRQHLSSLNDQAEQEKDPAKKLLLGAAAALEEGCPIHQKLVDDFAARYADTLYVLRDRGRVNSARFVGDSILTTTDAREVLLWSSRDGRPRGKPIDCCGPGATAARAAFDPSSGYLVASAKVGPAFVYKVGSGLDSEELSKPTTLGDRRGIRALQLGPDARSLLVSGHEFVRIFEPIAGGQQPIAEIGPLKGYNWFWHAALSPDGLTVASASNDGAITLRSAKTLGVLPPTLHGPLQGPVVHVAFSADSTQLIATRRTCLTEYECDSDPGSGVEIWDVVSGRRVDFFPAEGEFLSHGQFCGGGQQIAAIATKPGPSGEAGDERQYVRLWLRAKRRESPAMPPLAEDLLAIDGDCERTVSWSDVDSIAKVRSLPGNPNPRDAELLKIARGNDARALDAWQHILGLHITKGGKILSIDELVGAKATDVEQYIPLQNLPADWMPRCRR